MDRSVNASCYFPALRLQKIWELLCLCTIKTPGNVWKIGDHLCREFKYSTIEAKACRLVAQNLTQTLNDAFTFNLPPICVALSMVDDWMITQITQEKAKIRTGHHTKATLTGHLAVPAFWFWTPRASLAGWDRLTQAGDGITDSVASSKVVKSWVFYFIFIFWRRA